LANLPVKTVAGYWEQIATLSERPETDSERIFIISERRSAVSEHF
jgi:hypothetical protein